MAVYKSVERKRQKLSAELEDESTAGSSTDAEDTTVRERSTLQSGDLKNRVLLLTSRGVIHRHRHLLSDLHSLLPHSFKDTKLDTKSSNKYNATLNALAELHSCNYIFFLESRKHGQDLYLWLGRAPNGPTLKFSVSNIHTMGELGFGGNCLKGGRGIVLFDQSFENVSGGTEYRGLVREMLKGVFCVPKRGVRGMKPFVDHIVGVFGVDDKIWIRFYELREASESVSKGEKGKSVISLVEIGPRLVLTPIVILEGSFGGPVIYENKEYVSANQIRREVRVKKAGRYANRRENIAERSSKRQALGLDQTTKKRGELDNSVLFR